jgi:hypothetical protein
MNQNGQQRRHQRHHWQSAGKILTKMDNSTATSVTIGSLRAKYEPKKTTAPPPASQLAVCGQNMNQNGQQRATSFAIGSLRAKYELK